MAFATDTRHTGTGVAGYIDTLRANVAAWRSRRALFNQTYNELNALSDRDLADLGLARSDIGRIAREAAGITK